MSAQPEISPQAYFDCLAISASAPRSVGPLSVLEIHLFAYMACILALIEGQPVNEWGYTFALTSSGHPYSVGVDGAIELLLRQGKLRQDQNEMLELTEDVGRSEIDGLATIQSLKERQRWIQTATECALALPVGAIKFALGSTPGVDAAIALGQRRELLGEEDIDRLYEERKVIMEVLGESAVDLLAPAVAWLSMHLISEERAGGKK